jgi:hypothetical protein
MSAPGAAQAARHAAEASDCDWPAVARELDERGSCVLPRLLAPEDCAAVKAFWEHESAFRSRVVMARHNYGRGEYRYFAHPLPAVVARLRSALYPGLAPVANEWSLRLRAGVEYPPEHRRFLARCHAAGQTRPTPLLLRYGPGDYNCLHQDLYGEHVFPLQVAVLLAEPGRDFTGGELVLTEQRPRMQSRVEVVPLRQGDAVVFAVNQRPVRGSRGDYRVTMRHGVSRVHAGSRYTLGIIFHDAR